ncbi:MAG: hypothetical protein KDI55_25405, partial [Anaerolineae bacterium]|nr:hypothetical protein [Anaerolineae bacterium]
DANSDGEPDVWDYDNDGDKVPDNVDISPDYTGNISTQLHDDLTLDLSGFTTGKAIFVDLAIRPQEDRFLYLTDNVVDWPAADVDGQVTRVYTDTLADIGISHPDGKASNGDMILKNLLEITIPFDSSNPTGSLPKLSSYTGTITAATPLEDWLDEDALAQYGISVTQEEDGTRVAYVALNVVQDKTGDTPVAWGAHMLYRPEVAAWGTGHTARMLWMVYGITDSCTIPDSVEPESDEYQTWCDVENLDHWTAGSDI